MKLICDDREDGDVLKMVMEKIEGSEVERLFVGDYIEEDLDLCFERKTIDDFCGSIKDGRLKKQCESMIEFFPKEKCFILVSGRIGDRKSDIHEHCILGMMSSLVCMGVQVICVDNDEQLVYLMKRILERNGELYGTLRENFNSVEKEGKK